MNHEIVFQEDVWLAPYTTLKIGGRARFFVNATSEADVLNALSLAGTKQIPVFILGGGSNILVADKGFDGLVIRVALTGISVNEEPSGKVIVTANAGEDWDKFVEYCVTRELAGIECLSGIPGMVGGTPVQNVGAYGQDVSETIVAVRCFDRKTSEVISLSNADCGFSYRTSIFNTTHRERYVVLSVTFVLVSKGEPKLVYKDLTEHFGLQTPTLAQLRDAVLSIRRSKSMVIDPADPNSVSAGSFFKNPIINKELFATIAEAYDRVPSFPIDPERIKIPAAWLIENAGFHKGYSRNGAGISEKHTLAIINRGDASAKSITELKTDIQNAVETKFGVELQTEPVFVGFE